MPFFSSVEPAVPFFFRTSFLRLLSLAFSSSAQTSPTPPQPPKHTQVDGIDVDTVVSSSDNGATCVWDVAMARWRPSVKAQLPTSSPLPQAAARSRPTQDVLTTRGDLVLVRLTHGVTRGYADARETGGLCRGSRVPATASRWSARGGSCLTSASAGSVAGGGGVVFVWTS